LNAFRGTRKADSHARLPFGLPGNPENRYHSGAFRGHPGNPE
jgi:hypothetical protein